MFWSGLTSESMPVSKKKMEKMHQQPSQNKLAADEKKGHELLHQASAIRDKKGLLAAKEFLKKKGYRDWPHFS